MFQWQQITSHPRLAAVLDAAIALIFWWWLGRLDAGWQLSVWIFSRAFFITVLVRFTFYPPDWDRLRHLVSLYLFNFGFLLVLLFVEWNVATRFAGLLFIFAPAISFWLIPARADVARISFKPYRRVNLALSVLGLAGIWIGIFASIILNIFNINFWLWLISGAAFSALTAWWWWRRYDNSPSRKNAVWAGILGLMMLELAWVMYLLPLGYFLTGLIIVWFWYGLWLLIRFHLNGAGINWQKQKYFLIVNAVLFILLLTFLARWR